MTACRESVLSDPAKSASGDAVCRPGRRKRVERRAKRAVKYTPKNKCKDFVTRVLTGQLALNIYATTTAGLTALPVCVSSKSRDKPVQPGEPLAVVSQDERPRRPVVCSLTIEMYERETWSAMLLRGAGSKDPDAEKRHWRNTFQKTHQLQVRCSHRKCKVIVCPRQANVTNAKTNSHST